MMATDPASDTGRYHDLCGPDIGRVMSALDWEFGDSPVCVTLTTTDGQPVAIGFCAPIRLKKAPYQSRQFCGMNLSYAVHSEFEGQGYGLAAACLAVQEAESLWRGQLAGKAFLNIQTYDGNGRSNSLIRSLRATSPFKNPEFAIVLSTGEIRQYSGARFSWVAALSSAEAHLLSMPFLNEIDAEVEPDNSVEFSPAG